MDLRIRNRGVGDAGGNTRTFVQDVKIMANQTRFESITPMPMSSSAKKGKKTDGKPAKMLNDDSARNDSDKSFWARMNRMLVPPSTVQLT